MKTYPTIAVLVTLFIVLVALAASAMGLSLGRSLAEMDMALTAIRVAHVQCDLPEGSLVYRNHKLHENGVLEVYVTYNGSDSYSVLFGTLECSLGKG